MPEHPSAYEQDLNEKCQAKFIVSDKGNGEDDTENINEDHYSDVNETLKQEGYLMGKKISEKIIHCPNCGGDHSSQVSLYSGLMAKRLK